MMAPATVNVLLSTFPGLDLPPTLSIPVPSNVLIRDLPDYFPPRIIDLLPSLYLTTNSNIRLSPSSKHPLSTLLPDGATTTNLLPLRLHSPLCGGKGGFGSQLRAAGGRMSSRKKRREGGRDAQGSSRNLDGRRLRTVGEAKALAEYLAVKPEMEKREREERRKRWEAVVEAAERRVEEIKKGEGKGRLNGEWVEAKEEAGERTREAVLEAVKNGLVGDVLGTKESDSSGDASEEGDGSESEMEVEAEGKAESSKAKAGNAPRTFFGWDEEDEDDDTSDEDDEEDEASAAENSEPQKVAGKGKARA